MAQHGSFPARERTYPARGPQQAWAEYGRPVRKVLNLTDSHVIVSGMALGYADYTAKENQLITERAPHGDFVIRHR